MCSIFEIDSVTKSFGIKRILTDVYLKCETGDIVGLFGRNGTGKSTLLKIIFGTQKSDSKFIRIKGQFCNKPYKRKGLINYLPEESFLPKQFTINDIVKIYLNRSMADLFFNDNLISSKGKNKIRELSGGELRYIEIKLLLLSDAKFVLLDEPFNGLSPLVIEAIKDLIKMRSSDKGIILTDHDYVNVMDVANRFYLLFDGGIKSIRDKADLQNWGYLSEYLLAKIVG